MKYRGTWEGLRPLIGHVKLNKTVTFQSVFLFFKYFKNYLKQLKNHKLYYKSRLCSVSSLNILLYSVTRVKRQTHKSSIYNEIIDMESKDLIIVKAIYLNAAVVEHK